VWGLVTFLEYTISIVVMLNVESTSPLPSISSFMDAHPVYRIWYLLAVYLFLWGAIFKELWLFPIQISHSGFWRGPEISTSINRLFGKKPASPDEVIFAFETNESVQTRTTVLWIEIVWTLRLVAGMLMSFFTPLAVIIPPSAIGWFHDTVALCIGIFFGIWQLSDAILNLYDTVILAKLLPRVSMVGRWIMHALQVALLASVLFVGLASFNTFPTCTGDCRWRAEYAASCLISFTVFFFALHV